MYHAAGNAGRGSSSYIDSVILRDRDANGGGGWTGASDGTLEERRYYVQNWRADVVAITKSDGSPLQYVVYSPYGEPVTHAAADVDLDGDVDSSDQAAWANGAPNSTFAYAAMEDLNHDGSDTAADDALFDESYANNLGLSGRGRLSAAKLDNRKGYAGYEHDESITMYHARHRVYRADLGRWMTRDPLGCVDGMGLYKYQKGSPISTFAHRTADTFIHDNIDRPVDAKPCVPQPRMSVRCRKIPDLPASHCWLHYSDGCGKDESCGGGPENSEWPFGDLKADCGEEPADPNAPSEQLVPSDPLGPDRSTWINCPRGASIDDVWACVHREAERMNKAKCLYGLINGPNSNTLAQLMWRCASARGCGKFPKTGDGPSTAPRARAIGWPASPEGERQLDICLKRREGDYVD